MAIIIRGVRSTHAPVICGHVVLASYTILQCKTSRQINAVKKGMDSEVGQCSRKEAGSNPSTGTPRSKNSGQTDELRALIREKIAAALKTSLPMPAASASAAATPPTTADGKPTLCCALNQVTWLAMEAKIIISIGRVTARLRVKPKP